MTGRHSSRRQPPQDLGGVKRSSGPSADVPLFTASLVLVADLIPDIRFSPFNLPVKYRDRTAKLPYAVP